MAGVFQHGPFIFAAGTRGLVNGQAVTQWTMSYGAQFIAQRRIGADTQSEIIEAFGPDRGDFMRGAQAEHAPDVVHLVEASTGETLAEFPLTRDPDLTPGLINDSAQYWLRSANRKRSREITLRELPALPLAPINHWITGLLPDDVLTLDPNGWRAPTNWEIRHVVGEGSFTGITGAKAAELIGMTPGNFRKYTAADDAKNRQKISFSAWHSLLHRLGVQTIGVGHEN